MVLEGASALVTGASRGIGRAVALALAGSGARVTAVARSGGELRALVDEARAAGGAVAAVEADLRTRAGCDRAVAAAVEAHGGLQVLVNNAGVGAAHPVAETSDEEWEAVMALNLTGVFRVTRAALPHLTRRGGHVFMISSLAGQNAIAGMAAYCASKAALDHFSACLMLEVRQAGVKVTTIAPGSVDTAFGAAFRSGAGHGSWKLTAEDVAGAVLDLLRTRDEAHLSRVEMRPLRPPSSRT
jgi:NAD(P)-dependent dehydrogenase (short-subunit alcohol dehydrogenase family)